MNQIWLFSIAEDLLNLLSIDDLPALNVPLDIVSTRQKLFTPNFTFADGLKAFTFNLCAVLDYYVILIANIRNISHHTSNLRDCMDLQYIFSNVFDQLILLIQFFYLNFIVRNYKNFLIKYI